MNSNKYISNLLSVLFILALMLTGCAKDELIPPAGDVDSVAKHSVTSDSFRNNGGDDTDGITDDEDDEDDEDREVNR